MRPYRFAVWGARRGWIQIGSIEDQFYVRRAKQLARQRIAWARFNAGMAQLVTAFAEMGRAAERVTLQLGHAFGKAFGWDGMIPTRSTWPPDWDANGWLMLEKAERRARGE